jgi:cyclophilin family peptidyl-prolyl cis-trans isomerase
MLWPDCIIKKMTQVKRGTGRQLFAASRKQQRFSLLKIACSLVLICGFVGLLIQNDPFPGVRKAAMRQRRENELTKGDEAQRDFRNPQETKDEATTDIKDSKNSDAADSQTDEDDGSRTYTLELANLKDGKTGNVVIRTNPEWAPLGVQQFHQLMDDSFYTNAKFFRVVDDFIVQFGIPAIPSNKYKTPIKDDPVKQTNARGTITYATSGKDTRTTQLFINTRKAGNKFLDNQGFAPFGEVLEGMDIVDEIYDKYGERPNQGKIQQQGNEYLDKEFPLLSYIAKAYQGTPKDGEEGST